MCGGGERLLLARHRRRAIRGRRVLGRALRRAFVHSLVPIALVYVVAHYLTFLIFEGQAITYLASDPLGQGWDLFGTAGGAVDYGILSQENAWYLEVGFVVAGHVAALTLAHDRALVALSAGASRGEVAVLDARHHGRLHHTRAVAARAGGHMRRRAGSRACSPPPPGPRRAAAETAAPQGELDAPRRPLEEAALRERPRHRPRERRLPAHDQPRVLPHRPGRGPRDPAARHDQREGEVLVRRDVPARHGHRAADADRLRPPGQAGHAPVLPRLHPLGRQGAHMARRLAPRRGGPAQDRPASRPHVRLRCRVECNRDLPRRAAAPSRSTSPRAA